MFSCTQCDYFTSRKYDLKRHAKRHSNVPSTANLPPKIARREPFPNIIEPPANDNLLQDIENHEIQTLLDQNSQVGFGITQMTSPDENIPHEIQHFFRDEQPWGDDNELRDVYFRNFNLIRDIDQVHRRSRTYNRYLNGEETTLNEAMEHAIEQVYRLQNHSFKINLSFSAIFQNRETQEYKF